MCEINAKHIKQIIFDCNDHDDDDDEVEEEEEAKIGKQKTNWNGICRVDTLSALSIPLVLVQSCAKNERYFSIKNNNKRDDDVMRRII
jgi:hypothetical protein